MSIVSASNDFDNIGNMDSFNTVNTIDNVDNIANHIADDGDIANHIDNDGLMGTDFGNGELDTIGLDEVENDLINRDLLDTNLNNEKSQNNIKATSSSSFEDIQNLIDNADDNGVIELNGLYTGKGKAIYLNKPLTIKGVSETTLDASFLSPILIVNSTNVVLENINFINSYNISVDLYKNNVLVNNCYFNHSINGELGSALRVSANNITVLNSNFTNNIANKSSCHHTNGPAIYVQGNNFSAFDCIFINNSGYNYETESAGAAIFLIGHDSSIINCSFINNSATAKWGWTLHGEEQTYLADGIAGAVWLCGNRAKILDCRFLNNLAHSNGGAIYMRASSDSIIANSTFINNYAVANGGVIFLEQSVNNLHISNCEFINNTSQGLKGVVFSYYPYGGVLYTDNYVYDTFIDNCTFSNNNLCTLYYQGTNLNVNNSIFEYNSSKHVYDSSIGAENTECVLVYFNDSTFENNFWGTNFYSKEDFKNSKLIFSNGEYKSPVNWFNLKITGLNSLNEKGNYSYDLSFIPIHSIENKLPDYLVSLENNDSYNSLSLSKAIISKGINFNYEYNRSALDTISVYNNLGDLIISKDILCGVIYVKNTTDSARSIQEAIDNANPGDIIYLDSLNFTDVSNVNITKDITILGMGNASIFSEKNSVIFNVIPKSEGGPDSVVISNLLFKLDNGNKVLLINAENSSNPLEILVPFVNITDNRFESSDENVVGESITILEIDSERAILAPSSEINIKGNTLDTGINCFEFKITSILNESSVYVGENRFFEKIGTVIAYNDMTTTAIDSSIEPGTGEYFNITLKDSEGKTLANKYVRFGFNGKIYEKPTDANGVAQLQINLQRSDIYTFAVSFIGDNQYNGSFAVAKITVKKQKSSLTVPAKSYSASAKTKTLTATFKSASGKSVANKKIIFTVNGKSYSAKTNDKGIATVNVSLNKKGTYSFIAKFAGDNTYAAFSKSSKLVLK